MDGRFSRPLARLHSVGARRLADSVGRYVSQDRPPVCNLHLQIDESLGALGAEGVLLDGQCVVSWHKADLPNYAVRVGIFEVNGLRLLIETIIEDDGHRVIALCMELK